MNLSAELRACLAEFTADGAVELRENGGRLAPFAGLSWEVRGAAEKPLLHLWSENYNLTRRVLAITDHSERRLALAVERFGRTKPGRLEFIRLEFERSARELSREAFCDFLGRLLAERFADETVESLTAAPDLQHSLSGNYVRGLLRRGSSYIAVLAVPEGESVDTVEGSLTFALLWLARAQHSSRHGAITALRLILPKGGACHVAHRACALSPNFAIEFYERDSTRETLAQIDPRQAGNQNAWLVPHRETHALLDRARGEIESVIALAPRAVVAHPVVQSRQVWLRFRGLAFARWDDGRVLFGCPDQGEELTPTTLPALKTLLQSLKTHRHPLATETRHAFFRAQPERWLEALVREDVTRVDAALDPRFVYSQVFAQLGSEHGILDLLTVTRQGRLAILELKANEHIHLPLQAAGYWIRIRRQLEQDSFGRYGYFPGIKLQNAAPLVYLIAPALRFHPATDALMRCLSEEMETVRVGLAESWRRGLHVVMRQ
ncbi:MAG TPA: hypothetical protein VE077_01080 [Candidatus Methylomirabilis sp.]|nr:hypothetical protein [Candidatus Methylomirabilis sp.]